MPQKRLLITGFDPFGAHTRNPSWLAVEQLPDTVGEYVLCKLPVPTAYGEAAAAVIKAACAFHPDLILCVGLAGGRDAVTPERIAVNIRDARIPDNRGVACHGEPVIPDGPAAYFVTAPVEAMAASIRAAHIPGAVSNSAGTFVCNDTLYTLLHHFAGTPVRVGFIHVPCLPEQGTPSLPLDRTVAALTAAIEGCD